MTMSRKRWIMYAMVFGLALAGAQAQEAAPAEAAAGPEVAWEDDCSSIAGWHYDNDSKGMNCVVEQFEPSTIKIKQQGNDTWGKAAYVIHNIDIEKTPIVEVKVNKVDKGSAYTIAVTPTDWSEMITVIPRSSADGTFKGNIEKAVKKAKNRDAWENNPVSFNLVVIIEGKGKASYFDNFRIRAEK